jgi:hypothetical protein
LIDICLAALGGGVAGAVGCRLHLRQQMSLLQQRLLRSEEARNGAIERSANAREQIAQLSKAISELRRTHRPARAAAPAASNAQERRAAAEHALAQASDGQDRADQSGRVVFANTEPMQY